VLNNKNKKNLIFRRSIALGHGFGPIDGKVFENGFGIVWDGAVGTVVMDRLIMMKSTS
jgi:hypothetical protein